MRKGTELFEYMKAAKAAVREITPTGYEKHFENLENTDPNFDFLNQSIFVIDFRIGNYVYLSPNAINVCGYEREELIKLGVSKYVELFHPLDASIVATKFFPVGVAYMKERKGEDISKMRVSYSYRFKQKDGTYRMLFQQFSHLLLDEDSNPLVIMGSCTDISEIHTKPELFCRIHNQNTKGKWDKVYERIYSLTDVTEEYGLTPKEIEIIKFVHKGLSSKEIANLTKRSEETIKSQRKSIIAKTKCQTMMDVIVLAGKNGWV